MPPHKIPQVWVLNLGLALLASVSPPARAMQPLITDDTGTQGAGGRQLEFSLCGERNRTGDAGGTRDSLPLTLSWGADQALDLTLSSGFARVRANEGNASGWTNVVLGAKWRFFDDGQRGASLALKPEILLPVSAGGEEQGFGTGRASGRLGLILSQKLPFGSLHINTVLGRERYRDSAQNTNRLRLSVAPVWDLSARWKLAVDMGSEFARTQEVRTHARFAEVGAIWSPNKDVDLALGLIRALDDQRPRSMTSSMTAGLSWRF
jgi:hypothetical protein